MVIEGVGMSPADAVQIASNLPPDILGKIGVLVTIFQAVGIVFIIYVAFLITQVVINWRRNRKINQISSDIKLMNKNLEKLLKKK